MQVEMWAQIKRLKEVEKLSNRAIARRFGIDKKTVRRALQREKAPDHSDPRGRPSKLNPFKGYIQERVQKYPDLSGVVLLREIQNHGYSGKIKVLTDYLSEIRQKSKEVFLRIETSPGWQAQVDWANCGTVTIGHALRKLSCFVMVLSYSRKIYIEFTLSQCLEDFIQCHLNAFDYFGGITRKILYDNLKLVVLCRWGREIQFNPKFMEFAGVFGFEPVPCNVARGNEKGKAESGIYYIRKNFLAGREIRWPQICKEGRLWLDNVANLRVHRTTRQQPDNLWKEEKPYLLPLLERPYDASIVRAVHSTHQALVRFDGNAYSVPCTHAYQTLLLRSTIDTVRILAQDKEIACHLRSYDRGCVVEDPKHFAQIMAIKKKAFADRLQKSFMDLGSVAGNYLEGMADTQVHIGRHIAQIMELVATYGKQEVLGAMTYAFQFKAFGAAYVQNILLQKRDAQGFPEILPLTIPKKPSWNEIVTEEPDLSIYDKLMESKGDSTHE